MLNRVIIYARHVKRRREEGPRLVCARCPKGQEPSAPEKDPRGKRRKIKGGTVDGCKYRLVGETDDDLVPVIA